ncbi:TetR/AcrR family transcriptional regulator [Micromonosporaceae bacterium DT194]|uniref:TetR/AcrR family transcriptional regulator n=1 Tax=Melissospora conviva TaxID=3388432 RepID=UPI003C26C6B8
MTDKRRVPAGAAVLRGEITRSIRRALMQELAEVGYGRLSLEAVARRAGVSKTAIYRRWRSKLELVLEVVGGVAGKKLPLPDTGSLQGDLELLFQVMAAALQHPLASQIIPDLLAEAARNPGMAEPLQEALGAYQSSIGDLLIGRAQARGEVPESIDHRAATDIIVGPLYWRLMVARVPVDTDDLVRMAATAAMVLTAAPAAAADLPVAGVTVTTELLQA